MKSYLSTEKWGEKEAKSRYGSGVKSGLDAPKGEQAPQAPEDKHGEKYDNDCKSRGKY